VLREQDEELPLFMLDIGGAVTVLFGQWLDDPDIVDASESLHRAIGPRVGFFETFELRFASCSGIALGLKATGNGLVKAETVAFTPRFKRLRECEVIPGRSGSLAQDLVAAGITHPWEVQFSHSYPGFTSMNIVSTYDKVGRLTGQQFPGSVLHTYLYDANGNQTQVASPAGGAFGGMVQFGGGVSLAQDGGGLMIGERMFGHWSGRRTERGLFQDIVKRLLTHSWPLWFARRQSRTMENKLFP
jgi:YD repeat-containing protein